MMPDRLENTLLKEIVEALTQDPNGMKTLLEQIYNVAMRLERSHAIGAMPYQRSAERVAYANGYKDKTLQTRMGGLELKVPKVRGIEFYPQALEKGCRSEKALKLAVAEMYIKGVSTRKVQSITKQLCGLELTSMQVSRAAKELDESFEAFRNRPLGEFPYVTLDATYLKARQGGRVVDVACLIAYGVNKSGKRELLGVSVEPSEAEVHWRTFLTSLSERGLRGVRLITSDDHVGLAQARKAVLPCVPWQRCQFHMSQNAQHYAPNKGMQPEISQAMREIFGSPDRETARAMVKRHVKKFATSAPKFARWLEDNIEEGLTVYNYPPEHRKKLRTSNGMERLNKEIKKRTRIVGVFPSIESALRLVTGVLVEIHEDWVSRNRYLNMSLSGVWHVR